MTPHGIQPASQQMKLKMKYRNKTHVRENKNYVLKHSCTISERCSERLKGLNGDDAFVAVVNEMSVILPITRWILSSTQKYDSTMSLSLHARLVCRAIGSIVCALHSHSRASLRCMRARNHTHTHTRQMLNQLNVWRRRHRA